MNKRIQLFQYSFRCVLKLITQTINIVLNFYKCIANCVCYLQKSRQTPEDCLAPKPVKSNSAYGF